MAEKICPKCNKKSDNAIDCQYCEINFDEYETAKQENLIQVRVLLSENKYQEAKELAEKLPGWFPDNRTDFLLLLSNINRDISIVEKYDHAKQAYDEGNFDQILMLLRNIKAFDHNLNEKVISLRRKAERYLQNSDNFNKAVEAFDRSDYAQSKSLFKQIHGTDKQEEISDYLSKIGDITNSMLEEAIECIRSKQFDSAQEKFSTLQSSFPDMENEIEGYLTLLSKRIEIKNDILNAAKQAKKEKRLLESKILYSYLGLQFPEFQPQVQPQITEIGQDTVISLADLEESSIISLAGLGLDAIGGGQEGFASIADSKENVATDVIATDVDRNGLEDIVPVVSNRESPVDSASSSLEIDEEGVPDFSF